jgi:hypothetical protein
MANDFRWSFSQWETYDACPSKWKYQSVLKLPRAAPGPAAARGLLIHSTIERYIANEPGAELHDAISEKYLPVFNEFRDHPNGDRHVEYKLGLTTEWGVAPGFRSSAWCSMVLDAVRVGTDWRDKDHKDKESIAYVGEWKSGKPKDRHTDQRKLYALGALIRWPFVDEVQVTTYYVEDTAPPQRLRIKPSAADKLKDLWKGRVEQMRGDHYCAPKPGIHCNWCDFAKKKGGPCSFGS